MGAFRSASVIGALTAILLGAMSSAMAADLAVEHHHRYPHARQHPYRSDLPGAQYRGEVIVHHHFRWVRDDGGYRHVAAAARCPAKEKVDYDPKLLGDLDCQAARPRRLSTVLYNPVVKVQWGTEY